MGCRWQRSPTVPSQHIPVRGLDPMKRYEINGTGQILSGRVLMGGGLNFPRQEGDCQPVEFYLKEV